MKAIKLLIVDDSQIYLEGLKLILKPYNDICIVDEANTAHEALDRLKEHSPDIAILDINLEKNMDGIELAYAIKKDHPRISIIFLTHYKETKYLLSALRTQPAAYLPKDLTAEELVNTIQSVNNGKGIYLGETIPVANILEIFGTEQNAAKCKIYDMSPREIEIVRYLSQGYSTKELASMLRIEATTVESYKERIKEKMGVKTVVQIVVTAIRKGIINVDS